MERSDTDVCSGGGQLTRAGHSTLYSDSNKRNIHTFRYGWFQTFYSCGCCYQMVSDFWAAQSDGLASIATARRSDLYGHGSPASPLTAKARRPRLLGNASTAPPPRYRLDGFANTTTARRSHLYGHSLTASPSRPQLDGLASTATAGQLRLHGHHHAYAMLA